MDAQAREEQARKAHAFKALHERAGDQDYLDYAILHLDIIERFGRFPHRNPALGRVTTPEERAFLLAHDTDPFNKWEAGRALAKDVLARMIVEGAEVSRDWLAALARVEPVLAKHEARFG